MTTAQSDPAAARLFDARTLSERAFTDPHAVALGNAVEAGDLQAIARLLAQGADARVVGRRGVTLSLLALQARQHAPEVMEAVLVAGADPFARLEDGNAVPEYAVMRSHADPAVVDVLLSHGVPVDWRNARWGDDARTLLMQALMGHNLPVAELLLRRGADIDHVRPTWGSALHDALDGGDVASALFLVEAGIDLRLVDHPPARRGQPSHATAVERYCLGPRVPLGPLQRPTWQRLVAALAARGVTMSCGAG